MNIERKRELLKLSHSISVDINRQCCGNYMSKVINAIEIAESRNDIKLFFEVLKKMKKTSFGGKNQQDGFKVFADEIIKNPRYRIASLNFSELKMVFNWVRRLVKTKDQSDNRGISNNNHNRNENNNHNKNNKKRSKNIAYEDNDINYSPFAGLSNFKFE
ncbi:MAG: hypothetical protein E7214_10705 [Clostridium sp.]|nr:hypothetical protein [Clostridium sp.]